MGAGAVIPYRRGLARLPLQRSLFWRVGDAAKLLGLADTIPGRSFGAWLDQSGNLFLNRSHVDRLGEALPGRLMAGYVEAVEHAQRACCESLSAATERAHLARTADEIELRSLIVELAERIAAFLPYGVLSKLIPDVLLRALADAGDRLPPPFPRPSFGAELVAASRSLHRACLELGYSPERLGARWPALAPEVASRVRQFCQHHVGFGPLQWEAPGYEDPRYVFGMLRAAFGESTRAIREWHAPGRVEGAQPAGTAAGSSALRGYLAFWLDFLERETWYVRRAFYRGMIPLLRQLASLQANRRDRSGAERLLFLEIDELRSGALTVDLAPRLREYSTDAGYLARHGISVDRLAALFQNA